MILLFRRGAASFRGSYSLPCALVLTLSWIHVSFQEQKPGRGLEENILCLMTVKRPMSCFDVHERRSELCRVPSEDFE